MVSLLFWLIFSILGVQLFSGKFQECVDQVGERVSADVVPNKTECLRFPEKYTWRNAEANFDNVFNGFLALFLVVCRQTQSGVMEILENIPFWIFWWLKTYVSWLVELCFYCTRAGNTTQIQKKLNCKMILFMQIEAINYYFSHLRDLLYLKQKRGVKKISKHTSLTIFLVLCCDLGNVWRLDWGHAQRSRLYWGNTSCSIDNLLFF